MRLSVVLAVFFALTLGTLGAGYLALPFVASWMARNVLADNGFPEADVRIQSIGLTQLRITDIDLGPGKGAKIREATVDFSLGRLAEGIVDGITLLGPVVTVDVSPSGINLGPFSAEPGGDGEPAIRIVGPVKISDGRFSVSTPAGTVAADVDGDILLTDGLGTRADAVFALDHQAARVTGRLSGTIDDGNNVHLDIEIAEAESRAALAFSQLSGAVNLEGALPNDLGGRASLTMRDVAFESVPVGNVDFAGTLDAGAMFAELLIAGVGTGLTMQITGENDDVFDPASGVRVTGDIATDGLTGDFALPDDMNVIGALGFDLQGPQHSFRALPGLFSEHGLAMKSSISGQVKADLLGLFLPAQQIDATIDGTADIQIDRRGVQIRPAEHLDIDLGAPIAGRARSVQARLRPIDDIPFLLWGSQPEAALELGFRFTSDIEGVGVLGGEAGGAVWQTDQGTIFENMVVRFEPWQMRISGMDVIVESLRTALSGPGDELAVDVQGNARFSGVVTDGVRIAGGSVAFATDLAFDPAGIAVRPEGCIDLRAEALNIDDRTLRAGPLAMCPGDGRQPLLFIATGGEAAKRIDFNGTISGAEYTLEGLEDLAVAGTLPRFSGSASYDFGRRTWWAKTAVSGGDVNLESLDFGFGGFKGTLAIEGRDRLLGARVKLQSAALNDKMRPVRFAPVDLSGEGKLSADEVTFSGALTAPGNLIGALDVRHQWRDNRGRATVDVPEWQLGGIGEDIGAVMPVLKGLLVQPKGTLSARAEVGWSGARRSSSATVTAENVGFAAKAFDVYDIDTVIELTDLFQLKTAGEQTIVVGVVDAGLPFPGGRIAFEMPGDGTVSIREALWPFAGGAIGVRDVVIPLNKPFDDLEAQVEVLNAADLVRLADVDDLDVTGTLSGEIPLKITDQGAVLKDAYLRAVGGGAIRYTSPAATEALKQSGGNAEILAKALEDFQYTDLEITLDGPLDGEVAATAQVKGANPALYDGKKIELNVNLQGTLRDFLRSASVVQDLPGVLRERASRPESTQ